MSEVQTCFRRVEKKYLLTVDQYRAMLEGMAPHVAPDLHPRYTINNVYYDTPDFRLIRTSLEKPVYKEKLRVRSYGTPGPHDPVFVELKKKYDGVVYKRRITLESRECTRYLSGGPLKVGCQISREIDWFLERWQAVPAAFIGYDREAYAGVEDPELRITFDTDLRGRNWAVDLTRGDYGTRLLPHDVILMELKIPDAAPLWLARLLSENGIFQWSFSKYGTYYKQLLGVAPGYGTYRKESVKYA